MSTIGDFHMQKIGIPQSIMAFLNYAHKHPSQLDKDDIRVNFYECVSHDLSKLKKIMQVVNTKVLELRANPTFWDQVLKQYAKDFNLPNISKEELYNTKTSFQYKKELTSGYFDIH